MITINSISGGKTSAFMAKNYPTTYNVFALVCIEDKNCTPKDKKIVQLISDKIGKQFIASAESDLTLKVVLDLEQIIGSEIKWLTGETFEHVIKKKKALPNMMWRFCTTEMKIKPIFDFCQKELKEIVLMNIGFRFDEKERVKNENKKFKTIIGKTPNGRNKWAEVHWRELNYPLINDKIIHPKVIEWAKKTNLIFPEDSNCVGCFWKPLQQLRKNWQTENNKMNWFAKMETQTGRKFKKEMSYNTVKKIGLQTDFIFGTGAGCNAGYCTD